MKRMMVISVGMLFVANCGDLDMSADGKRSEQQDCWEQLPAEVQNRIDQAYAENQDNRDSAIKAEQTRLGVEPLRPTTILTDSADYGNRYLPDTDPFPESVVVIGEDYDIRSEGYELNHGKMGMTRVYETSEGSGRFFIVDRIGGDGIGGNGSSVVAESVEYGLLNFSDEVATGYSWHSWHVSADNQLVRANQSPTDEVQQEIKVCGCGPGGYEVDGEKAGDAAPARYRIAIFMLPGDVTPTLLGEDEFTAKFTRKYFKTHYVPAPGKTCRKHEVVC